MATGASGSLRCFQVEVSGTEICELSGERISVTIPREQIRRIKLCYDTNAKNPFCQFFLGFTLFSLGLIGLVVTFFAITGRGYPIRSDPGVFVLPLIPIALWFMAGTGFWLLAGVLRARYFLLVETEKGLHKIFFGKSADVNAIRRFIWKAHMNFGYAIDISITDTGKDRPSP